MPGILVFHLSPAEENPPRVSAVDVAGQFGSRENLVLWTGSEPQRNHQDDDMKLVC